MLPDWNKAQQEQLTNDILAHYAIPVVVRPASNSDGACTWEVSVLGGTLEAALERIHALQERIIGRISKHGMGAVSRQDALFMYASQWLEWTVVRGEETPDYAEVLELMEVWAVLFLSRGPGFLN